MRKLITTLILIFIFLPLAAQKVKVDKKKGTMEVDKNLVAKFEETKDENKNSVFIFTSLDDKNSLTLVEHILPPQEGSQERDVFFKVSSSFNNKVSEIDYEMIVFSLNSRSIASNLIVKKYKFIDANGFNIDSINVFLDTPIETREQKREKALAELKQKEELRNNRIAEYAPSIENIGKVDYINTKGQKQGFVNQYDIISKASGKKMGYIYTPENFKFGSTNSTVLVFNNEKVVLGKITGVGANGMYPMETYGNRSFDIKAKDAAGLMKNMVDELIINDLFGTDKYSPAAVEARDKEYSRENKARTDVQGVLTLKEADEKVEGQFRLFFRQSPEGIVKKPSGNIMDVSGTDDGLTHMFKDDKGKYKQKIYKQNQVATFDIIKDGQIIEAYRTISYERLSKQSAIVNNDGLDVASLGKSLFKKATKTDDKRSLKTTLAMLVKETPKVTIYKAESGYIAFKKGNEIGLELDFNQINQCLAEVASECDVVSKKAIANEYDSKTSIKTIIEDLEQCK